jgi:5-methylcytosine-specific restriction endonuclease McrA
MTARGHVPTRERVKLLGEHGEACAACQISLKGRVWHLDHKTPLAMGGSDDRSNWQPLCVACHAEKTRAEAPTRAKALRLEALTKGAKAPSRTPLPCGSRSPFKKKLNGEVVRR